MFCRSLISVFLSIMLNLVFLHLVFDMFEKSEDMYQSQRQIVIDSFGRADGLKKRVTLSTRTARSGIADRGKSVSKKYDLKSSFSRRDLVAAAGGGKPGPGSTGFGSEYGKRLLVEDTAARDTVRRFVDLVNQSLDYPVMLVENNISGRAVMDIYFDSKGNVDEKKSEIHGSNRYIRGLFVKAVRKGVRKWYDSSFGSIEYRKKMMRNMHLRALFKIDSYLERNLPGVGKVTREGYNTFTFTRRAYRPQIQDCLADTFVNLLCVPYQVAGLIKRQTSSRYKIRFTALKEELAYYDSIVLRGIGKKTVG